MQQQITPNYAVDILNNIVAQRSGQNRWYKEATACKEHLLTFFKEFWPVVATDNQPPVINWHIPYICEELEIIAHRVANWQPKQYDLVINIPPGSTKTTLVSIMFQVWCWINWQWMRFICGSYAMNLSLASANQVRTIIRSEKFRAYFPGLEIKEDQDTKSDFQIVYRDLTGAVKLGGNRYSTAVRSGITGFHAHIKIVDDPIDPKGAISRLKVEDANSWMEQVLSSRNVDDNITTQILIMQRLAEDDPTGKAIKNANKVPIRHICLPGEIKNYKHYVRPIELINNYTDDGLLDPVRGSWPALYKAEAVLGQLGYAGQIGQNPSPPEGSFFDISKFNYRQPLTDEERMHIISSVRYWDKAGTEGGTGARTAGVLMHMTDHTPARFIVEDAVFGRWSAADREDVIADTADRDGVEVHVVVEQEPGSGGKESAEATERNLADYVVEKDRPTGDKAYRADPWSVKVKRGVVDLIAGSWNDEYVKEHRYFDPNRSVGTKDIVDASSGAHIFLTKKKQVRSLRTRLHKNR